MRLILFLLVMALGGPAYCGGDVFSKYSGLYKDQERHFIKIETKVSSISSPTVEKLISFKLCSLADKNECKILGGTESFRLSYFISRIQNRNDASLFGGAAAGLVGWKMAMGLLFTAPAGWPFAVGILTGATIGAAIGYFATDLAVANNLNSKDLVGDATVYTDSRVSIYDFARILDSDLRSLPIEARASGY